MKHIKHKKESNFKNIFLYNKSLLKSIAITFLSIMIVFVGIGIAVNIKVHKDRMSNLQNKVYSMEDEINFYSRQEKVYKNNATVYQYTTIKPSKNDKAEELYLTISEKEKNSSSVSISNDKTTSMPSHSYNKPSTTKYRPSIASTKHYYTTSKHNTTHYITTHPTTIKEETPITTVSTTKEDITEPSIVTDIDDITSIN